MIINIKSIQKICDLHSGDKYNFFNLNKKFNSLKNRKVVAVIVQTRVTHPKRRKQSV
jgi:hypothetical protein